MRISSPLRATATKEKVFTKEEHQAQERRLNMVLSTEAGGRMGDLDKGQTMQNAVCAYGCSGTSDGAFDSGLGRIDVADLVHGTHAKFKKARVGAAKGTVFGATDDSRSGDDDEQEEDTAPAG